MIEKLKVTTKMLLCQVLSYFPTNLPVGTSQFETWADSIIALSGEYADKDSMRFAIASMLIHADSSKGSLPKNYFVVRLRKSAANQIASSVFQDIKVKQAAQLEAAKTSVEDTTTMKQPESGKA